MTMSSSHSKLLHKTMGLKVKIVGKIEMNVRRKKYKYPRKHCMKSVRVRSYSGPHFPAFGLNTESDSVSLRIQSECGKIRNRITPNTDTFYVVKSTAKHIFHSSSPQNAIATWKKSTNLVDN